MAIATDYHIHSDFSGDSDTPMERMILRGIELGLNAMCFTEHMDRGMVENGISFEVDTPAYRKGFQKAREKYQGKIELLFGIELGLEPANTQFLQSYVNEYKFDFVIGSSHTVEGRDPYFPEFYEGRGEEEAYRSYFETIEKNLDVFSDIDTYGHLDYVVRYGPNKNKYYTFEKYRDVIEPALRKMIEKGVGLEVNSAGYSKGLGTPNPCPDIIRAYRRLGGEIITVGSDAHSPERLAADFDRVRELLLECGFRYYTVFRGRKPEFVAL
ncbi:MAG: histidinol-phosphatase HisJ family protein [Eubacteriales bacterium]|nr:histidinol-phosphatase HisJ family protein [Eubacteriales bacterium]